MRPIPTKPMTRFVSVLPTAFLLLAALVDSRIARGETPLTFEARTIETDVVLRWARALGDVIGDGLTDILIQDNNGHLDVLGVAHPGEWKNAAAPTEIYWHRNPLPDGNRLPSHDASGIAFHVVRMDNRLDSVVRGGPRPGDVFREYLWTNTGGDADGSLRVGGRLDYGGGPIELAGEFDLKHALRAEIVVEKLLCHDGTRGLEISVNDNAWIEVPESPGIPRPQWQYMHHIYPIVPVPLAQLNAGGGNQVRLRVSDEHPWKWPQNLVYGVHVRIYYDPAKKPHPTGRLISPHPGAAVGTHVVLEAEASSPNGPICQVDFLGCYEDVNLEGDGEYTQWHYYFHRAVLAGHIGSTTSAPWRLTWDTSWVPDQPQPFRLAARITDESGLAYFSPAVGDLTFARGELSVELCKPYDVPKQWLTRKGEHSQKFCVTGNLQHAVAARLVWVSWCPGYMEGLYVNEQWVLEREGPRYAYFVHRVGLPDLTVLQPGENILKTGMTPKYDGKMVHGMEVNWPGIMVLIQYRKP